jgi:sugar lactone lactonase YvrE
MSSAALTAATAGTAAADTGRVLPMTSYGDMVVDGVHQKLFLSDPSGGEIVVTDYSGEVLATVADLPGVRGLALSGDSQEVYAAVQGADRIVSLDTASYGTEARYDLGGAHAPTTLETAGGRLWFGYEGGLGSIDPSVEGGDVETGVGPDLWAGDTPILGGSAGAPGMLVAASTDWATVSVFDIVDGQANLRTTRQVTGNFQEIDLTPDGKQVLTTWGDGYGYSFPAYSTQDLSQVASYPTEPYPNAVDIAPDGTVAAGTDSTYETDVHIHAPGRTEPVREYDFPDTGSYTGADTLVPRGLAWAPDESRLFAVSTNDQGVLSLRAMDNPAQEPSTVNLDAPAKAQRGKPLTIRGQVVSAREFTGGAEVSVRRIGDPSEGEGTVVATLPLAPDGSFSYTETPSTVGAVTYTFSFSGDATHAPADASATVEVTRSGN